jgi:hypothetical protein
MKFTENFVEYRARLLIERKFSDFLMTFGGHEGAVAFAKIMPLLVSGSAEYWALLTERWTLLRVSHPDKRFWLRAWNAKNRSFAMNDEERAKFAWLPNEVTVYRGIDNRAGINGLSWTIDPQRAEFFASSSCAFDRVPYVFGVREPFVVTGQCRKSDIFALLMDRDEDEVVIDPSKIRNKIVSSLPDFAVPSGECF